MFVGGSSGTVTAAVRSCCEEHPPAARCPPTVATLFPDRGERYFHTIYDDTRVRGTYPALARTFSP